jgi:SAM-dependent methyltransferase
LTSLLRRLKTGRAVAPATPPGTAAVPLDEESLGRALLRLDGGLGLFRLAHLEDAVRRLSGVRSILSVGSGLGLHEAWLAVTRPEVTVVGVDLRLPRFDRDIPNLRFVQGDLFDPAVRSRLPAADFVYSIECLEHVEDDASVFGAMASCVRPGGSLYVQAPFASEAEQRDPELCRIEREQHEHVRPGYDERRLRRLAEECGLKVERIAAAFRFPLQPLVWAGTEKIADAFLAPRWRKVYDLVTTDVHDGLAVDRTEATAIKMLARKP